MKKTALILLSFLCFSTTRAHAQDSVSYTPKWNSVRFFVSAMPGFQVYTNQYSVITLALSFGASYRHYVHKWPRLFYDADVSSTQMILDGGKHTSFIKANFGIGHISSMYNVQLHAAYARNFTSAGDLVGLGYDVEAASIPITIDFLHFTNNSQYLYMVGIKVPLFSDIRF